MNIRVAAFAALAASVLAAAAVAPALARPASASVALDERPVPKDLLGMLASDCLDGVVFPMYVSVELTVDGDRAALVLSRSSASDVDPTSFPIVDFTPQEAALRDRLDSCMAGRPVAREDMIPGAQAVDSLLYRDYRERRLLPCLSAHGISAITPSALGLGAGAYDWYIASLYQAPSLDEALDTWYDCPVLPPYLDAD